MGKSLACFKSLLRADGVLNSIVSQRNFDLLGNAKEKKKKNYIKGIITGQQSVLQLRKSIAILEPIDKHIVCFQDNKIPVSKVFQAFYNLPSDFLSISSLSTNK